MAFIVRWLQGDPNEPVSEMKRLRKMSEKEVAEEVQKFRERLIKKNQLAKPPTPRGNGRGFLNLGNTCFISATLQCLLHCPQLMERFSRKEWPDSLNPLTSAFQGKLAIEFYRLMCLYWNGTVVAADLGSLHTLLSEVNKELQDFAQHDSQEFLAFFLDALHDDLNKRVVRRYEEAPDWKGEPVETYCLRLRELFGRNNDSFVSDLFYGQFCSQIECPSPECGRKSVSCEPFNMISLDPPSTTSIVTFQFQYLPATTDVRSQVIAVGCLDTQSMDTLLQHITSQRPELSSPRFRFMTYRYADLQSLSPNFEGSSVGTLFYSPTVLVAAEVVSPSILQLVFGRDPTAPIDQGDGSWGTLIISPYNNKFREGKERVLLVPRDANRTKIQLAVYLVFRQLFVLNHFLPLPGADLTSPTTYEELVYEFGLLSSRMNDFRYKSPFDVKIFSRGVEITSNEALFAVGTDQLEARVYFALPESSVKPFFMETETVHMDDLQFDRPQVSLEDCLEKFSGKETLDQENMWFCPGCRQHKKASKKMLISRLPPVLVVHLKRFKRVAPDRPQFRKFGDLITFPIEGLDMAPHCTDPKTSAEYDLFAVSSHFGTVSNGHYIAYCKNPGELTWTCFDDRNVRSADEIEVANKHAYLLFYSRRIK